MAAFVQSIRSFGFRGLHLVTRFRFILIGLLVLGIGILVGQSIRSIEQGELALSIVTVIILLVIALRKPLDALMIWILTFALPGDLDQHSNGSRYSGSLL